VDQAVAPTKPAEQLAVQHFNLQVPAAVLVTQEVTELLHKWVQAAALAAQVAVMPMVDQDENIALTEHQGFMQVVVVVATAPHLLMLKVRAVAPIILVAVATAAVLDLAEDYLAQEL
jgi:hypothetical protein